MLWMLHDEWFQKKNVPVYAHIKNFLTFQPAKCWIREESLKLKHSEYKEALPG
jgi:hypothetical protein